MSDRIGVCVIYSGTTGMVDAYDVTAGAGNADLASAVHPSDDARARNDVVGAKPIAMIGRGLEEDRGG